MRKLKSFFEIPLPLRILRLLISLVYGQSALTPLTPRVTPADSTPRLAVMSAFAPEISKLLKATDVTNAYVVNGHTYYTGRLAGNEVVIVRSGVSMVNAAMVTQTTLDHFEVRGVIFSGIAGGVNPNLNIGDVVVPARWAQYQEQVFARETAKGWNVGWHSRKFGNFGMMFPQPVFVTRQGIRTDREEPIFWFETDPAMLEVARQVAGSVTLKDHAFYYLRLAHKPVIRVGGNGVSGPTLVDNAEYRAWVWDTFEADALDMETAAVAHVAYANETPFIAFRSLSDLAGGKALAGGQALAGGKADKHSLLKFFQLAADNSSLVVIAFLEAWTKQ
jgi:adenosylhomocysteine nucleosidase